MRNLAAKRFAGAFLAFAMFVVPLSVGAQTRVSAPRNKYKVEDDVKAGQQAAAEAERRFPILNDSYVTSYVQRVGNRLVDAIPSEYDYSQFRYTFKVVNARDINAFALPGGPMYVNRGMIQAAKNEGEMAGVMAHEIAHVALRHGTAGATRQSGIGTQLGVIGLILGGAILGGQAGAQAGQVAAAAWQTKYSREYETQADILGAQIMARAGYDPVDLANMFQTIAGQGGGRGPEFLSSHPNPGNRFNRINQEAALLRVNNPIRNTREFTEVKARLGGLGNAPTTAEIERGGGQNYPSGNTSAGTGYSRSVPAPSTRYRTYNANNFISVSVPSNWQEYGESGSVTFAPSGAYGQEGLTHGALVGAAQASSSNLRSATQNYISQLLQGSNSYLRQSGGYSSTTLDGRNALVTQLTGRSPITNQTEVVTIYTTQLRDGNLLYVATVAPSYNSSSYNRAFSNMLRTLQINE